MAREKIVLAMSLRELGERVNESAVGEPFDEGFRDLDGHPLNDEQVVALARRIQAETGEQIVFEPPVD